MGLKSFLQKAVGKYTDEKASNFTGQERHNYSSNESLYTNLSDNLLYNIYDGSNAEQKLKTIYEKVNDSTGMLEFDIPNWGIKDFINERNYWIKGTNLNHGNEPGWFYFKVFFKFNTGYGLFGGLFKDYNNKQATKTDVLRRLDDRNTEKIELDVTALYNVEANSANSYLKSLSALGSYNHLKLEDRAHALMRFSAMLFNTSIKTPWMIKGINNLQNALNVNLNNFSEEKSFDLLFNTETTDFRLSTLCDLYKYACYDDINCKEIIPENLRKFDMNVIIYHMPIKYIQTGISVLNYGPLMKTMDLIEQAAAVVEKFYPNSGTNLGVNVVNSISGVVKALASESSLFDYKSLMPYCNGKNDFSNMMSYKMLTFQNCEIDTSSFGKYLENVEIKNETPFQFGSSALKIKYDRVYYHNSNEWNQFMFGSDGFYYNTHKTLERNLDNNFNNKSSKDKSFWDIFKKDAEDKNENDSSIWAARINALSQIHGYAGNAAALSPDQWKPLLDYADIAVHDSLRDYDMEDLVVPDKAISFDLKSGNIYENFTKVKSEDVIMNAILGSDQNNNVFNKSKYFLDKLQQLKDNNNIGNLFGELCSKQIYGDISEKRKKVKAGKSQDKFAQGLGILPNSSEMNTLLNISGSKNIITYDLEDPNLDEHHISKYYDLKLSKLQTESTSRELYNTNILSSIINDALNVYNDNHPDTTIDLLSVQHNNLGNKNLYGDFGPKTVTNDQFTDMKNISGHSDKLNFINVTNTNDLNSLIKQTKDYFTRKMLYLSTEPLPADYSITSLTGNIYGADFITYTSSYTTDGNIIEQRNITDYFNKKIRTLVLNSYETPVRDEFGLTVFESNHYTNLGSIYLENFGLYGDIRNPYRRKRTQYYQNKMSLLATNQYKKTKSPVSGNIYDYDMTMYSYNGIRMYTDAFANKMNRLKDSYTLTGNIYDYDYNSYTTLFKTKMMHLATYESTTTLIGNIYHYDMSMTGDINNRTYTSRFIDKINKLKDSYTLTGNIYDYDYNSYTTLFKSKMMHLATYQSTTTLIGNIYHYDMSMTGDINNRTYTSRFIDKINKLKDSYTLTGNIYDYDYNSYTTLFKTKMMHLATYQSTTTLIGNIYHYDMSMTGDINNRTYTSRFIEKINKLKDSYTLTGNIYDYDYNSYTTLFKTKMSHLATNESMETLVGNIYYHDMSITGDSKNRTITERFSNKMNNMVSPNTLTGNIYDYDLDAASELFKTKMAHLATNENKSMETLIGNIYGHNMNIDGDIFNRTITGLFGNKIQNLINASSNIGNLYKEYTFKDINSLDFTGASPVKLINNQYILTSDVLPDSDKNEFNEHIIQTIDSSNDYKQNIISGAVPVEEINNQYVLTSGILPETDKNEFNEKVAIFDLDGKIKNSNEYKQNVISGATKVEAVNNQYVLTYGALPETDKNEFNEKVAIFELDGKIKNSNEYKQNVISGATQVEAVNNQYILTYNDLPETDKNEFNEKDAIFDLDGKIKYSKQYREFIKQDAYKNPMVFTGSKYSDQAQSIELTKLNRKTLKDSLESGKLDESDESVKHPENIVSQLANHSSTTNKNGIINLENTQRLRDEIFRASVNNTVTFNEDGQTDEAREFISKNNDIGSWGPRQITDKKHFTTVQEWASKNVLARLAGNATKLITQATDMIKNATKK